MAGGSLTRPDCTVAWPQSEFAAMGLEGAVHLGALPKRMEYRQRYEHRFVDV